MIDVGLLKKDHIFIEEIRKILKKGNNVEIKQRSDGTPVIYEVKKNKVTV